MMQSSDNLNFLLQNLQEKQVHFPRDKIAFLNNSIVIELQISHSLITSNYCLFPIRSKIWQIKALSSVLNVICISCDIVIRKNKHSHQVVADLLIYYQQKSYISSVDLF